MTEGPMHGGNKSAYVVHGADWFVVTVDNVDIYRDDMGGATCALVWGATYRDYFILTSCHQMEHPTGDLVRLSASTRTQIAAVIALLGLLP